MWEDSVVTNAGAALLARWARGGTLVIDRATAGTGTIKAVSLAGSTKLVNEKQTLSIVGTKEVDGGIQYNIQFDAPEIEYTVNQVGIWAHLNNEKSVLIAIYQDEVGVSIPSKEEMPDFVYAFYAVIQMDNTGELRVNINSNVYITQEAFEERISELAKADLSNATPDALGNLGAVSKAGDNMTGPLTISDEEPLLEVFSTKYKTYLRLAIVRASGNAGILFYDPSERKSYWLVLREAESGKVRLLGNAETATKLQEARKINGVLFDGSKDIDIEDSTKLPLKGGKITGYLISAEYIRVETSNGFAQLNVSDTGNCGLWVQNKKGNSGWIGYMDVNGNIILPGTANSAKKLSNTLGIDGGGTDATTAEGARANFDLAWKANDTFSASSYYPIACFLTESSKTLQITLNLGCYINASRVSVTELVGSLRGVSGYLDNDSSNRDLLASPFTVSASIINKKAGLVHLVITKSSAFTNATNNTPASLYATSLSLKFS